MIDTKYINLFGRFVFFIVTIMALPACADEPKKNIQPNMEHQVLVRYAAKLLEELHYSKPKINDDVSKKLFQDYLQKLDPNRHFFLQSDMEEFRYYQNKLDDMLINGDAKFAFIAHKRLLKRMKQRIDYVKKNINTSFDFTEKEYITLDRKEHPWAKNQQELNLIWRGQIKNHLLQAKLKLLMDKEKKLKEEEVLKTAKERFIKRYVRYHRFLKNNDEYDVLEYYLASLAEIFDPHTTYMNWRTLEDFNITLKLSLEGIGAVLTTEDGYAKVVRIIPGGAADKDGQLKAGYFITAVGQGDKPAESIVDMPLTKAVQKIRGKKGTQVTLTVIKNLQDVPFEIKIIREKIKLTEQAARGETKEVNIPGKGKVKIGIIYLPSFYADFEVLSKNDPNARSTMRDVKKIIDNMKKEQVDGLVIDLRSNAGGSLEEVIGLAGMFIKTGPVVQIKVVGYGKEVRSDKDAFAYKMPLMVMVDTFSASASEIFAGVIQDYKRGIVVGQQTYGKGTVQNLLDLKRLRILRDKKPGAMKYTMAKFYRITGASTQKRGVMPDILYPTFFDRNEYGEASLKNVMDWSQISSAKYTESTFDIERLLPILRKKHEERIKNNRKFNEIKEYAALWNKRKQQKQLSLNLKERLQQKKADDAWYDKVEEMLDRRFNQDEKPKGKDPYLLETLEIFKDYLLEKEK